MAHDEPFCRRRRAVPERGRHSLLQGRVDRSGLARVRHYVAVGTALGGGSPRGVPSIITPEIHYRLFGFAARPLSSSAVSTANRLYSGPSAFLSWPSSAMVQRDSATILEAGSSSPLALLTCN